MPRKRYRHSLVGKQTARAANIYAHSSSIQPAGVCCTGWINGWHKPNILGKAQGQLKWKFRVPGTVSPRPRPFCTICKLFLEVVIRWRGSQSERTDWCIWRLLFPVAAPSFWSVATDCSCNCCKKPLKSLAVSLWFVGVVQYLLWWPDLKAD